MSKKKTILGASLKSNKSIFYTWKKFQNILIHINK